MTPPSLLRRRTRLEDNPRLATQHGTRRVRRTTIADGGFRATALSEEMARLDGRSGQRLIKLVILRLPRLVAQKRTVNIVLNPAVPNGVFPVNGTPAFRHPSFSIERQQWRRKPVGSDGM